MSVPTEEELAGIEALRRRDVEASLRLDGEALASLWTDDAVGLAPGKPPTRGIAAMRAQAAAVTAAREALEILDYREEFEETLVFGDTAVEWGAVSGSERDRRTGAVTASRFHVMRILRRQPDGSWRVHRSIFAPAEQP